MQEYMEYAEEKGLHGFALYTLKDKGDLYGKIWYKQCEDGLIKVDDLTYSDGVQIFLL